MSVELRPHQENVLKQMTNGKVMWGGVGSGKSITAMAYYMQNEAPKNVYVITTAGKRDRLEWEDEAVKFGVTGKPGATTAGLLVVDSWNNIAKYTEVEDAFFIFDEQRLVGSGAWVKAFYKIAKKNNWILLTATPGDIWMDYIPLFVANGLYKHKTEFCREHVIWAPYTKFPKVHAYRNTAILEKYKAMLLVEMPFESHTTRHLEYVECGYDEGLLKQAQEDRWHVFEDRPIEDVAEMFRVVREIGSTHSSRLDAFLDILQEHKKLIVFYNFNYERDMLLELRNLVQIGEWNGHRKTPVPEGDEWIHIVQYASGAEGWNCTETDTTVFWSLTYSWKIFEQAQGRIDRMNTPFTDLYYYALWSPTFAEKAIRKSLDQKEMFNERPYYDMFPDLIKEKD